MSSSTLVCHVVHVIHLSCVGVFKLLSEGQPSENGYRDERIHKILVKVRMLVSCVVLDHILNSHIFLIGFCSEKGIRGELEVLIIQLHKANYVI